MPSAAYFRRQADLCNRLALLSSERHFADLLMKMAKEFQDKASQSPDSGTVPAITGSAHNAG
jgi:hypothetical protein